MKIVFETLKFKNIFSYGNKVNEFQFQNGIDLITGKNGRGKSTLVDAITFALFGKPFRKIKLANLINNKNNKELWVELVFSINNSRFKIERGQKPNIFKIYKYSKDENWDFIDQHSTARDYQIYLEENILHFSDTVFRQLIALGANLDSSKGFMDLSKKEKEEVLQVITDTAVFTKIQEKITERRNSIKTKLVDLEYQEQILSNSINSLKISINSMETQNQEFIFNRDSDISKLENELENLQSEIPKFESLLKALDDLVIKRQDLVIQTSPYEQELIENEKEKQDVISKIKLYMMNEENKIICENCGNEIKQKLDFDIESLKKRKEKIDKIESSVREKYLVIKKEITELEEKLAKRPLVLEKMKTIESSIERINENLLKLRNWKEAKIDYSELEKSEKEYVEVGEKLVKNRKLFSELNTLSSLISDKNIKGLVLNQQLPFLNKFINEFLELFESQFNFVIDDNFEDNIVSRNVNNEFNSLSNGQKQRITMSILFAFLRLIEERNGVSTNLLILDEYLDSSLDVDGINEVLKIISEVFSPKKDVILISHNPDIKNRFELLNRSIEIKQKDGFSFMDFKGE